MSRGRKIRQSSLTENTGEQVITLRKVDWCRNHFSRVLTCGLDAAGQRENKELG